MSPTRMLSRVIPSGLALATVIFGTACSDSTGPSNSGNGNDAGALATREPGGTSTPPSERPAPSTNTAVSQSGSQASEVMKPDFLQGDLGPCKWSGNFCIRTMDIGIGYPLNVAVEFNRAGSNTYAYIWIWDGIRGWVEAYAVARSDLTVWYKIYSTWFRYQSGTVWNANGTFTIYPNDACGYEYLCHMGMLEANKLLPNGYSVATMLRRLANALP